MQFWITALELSNRIPKEFQNRRNTWCQVIWDEIFVIFWNSKKYVEICVSVFKMWKLLLKYYCSRRISLEFGYTLLDSFIKKKKNLLFLYGRRFVIHFGGSSVQSMTFYKKKRKWCHWKWFYSAVKSLPVIDRDADLQRIGHPYLFLIMTQANWFVLMSIKLSNAMDKSKSYINFIIVLY